MEYTVTLTDLEDKAMKHENVDVGKILQDIITGNVQQRVKRISESLHRKQEFDEETLLNAMFGAEGYTDAKQKADATESRCN